MVLAYGQSDEFSFVLRKFSTLYERRARRVQSSCVLRRRGFVCTPRRTHARAVRRSKLTSVIVSLFASTYVMRWREHLPDTPLQYAPAFDARAVRCAASPPALAPQALTCVHAPNQVCYPSDGALRDYLSWRQADCHINNQYNAAFWALVRRSGASRAEAQARLAGTQTAEKNELLFSEFGISYGSLPAMHRKGSLLRRERREEPLPGRPPGPDGAPPTRARTRVVIEHDDVIGDAFWQAHPELLAG